MALTYLTQRARVATLRGSSSFWGNPRRFSTPATSSSGIAVEYDDNNGSLVAVVRLSRPERMNSVNSSMAQALKDLPTTLRAETRAVMITGEGDKAFSTGRDLKESKQHNKEEASVYMKLCLDSALAVKRLPMPTLAVINGFAFGWGVELALCCDLRVVKADAVMCFPETSLGIFPGASGTVLLSRLVGPSVAKDLIFTSRRFDGDEALRLGVVNRSVDGDVEATLVEGLALARQIASNGPLGLKSAKVVIDQGLDLDFEKHVELSNQYRLPLNDTLDFKEALEAFENKRKPVFKGE